MNNCTEETNRIIEFICFIEAIKLDEISDLVQSDVAADTRVV